MVWLIIVIVILTCLSIFSISKWFVYYHATRGLLYYLIKKHNDIINAEKARELVDMSINLKSKIKKAPSTDRAKESDYYKCGLLKWSKTPLISRITLCVSLAALIISMIVRYTTE